MRVLILSQYFWPENFRIDDVALGLHRRGHQVTVLTGNPNYPQGRFYPGYPRWSDQQWQGIRIVRVPLIPRGNAGFARLALNYASFALSSRALGPLRCRERFDAVFVFQPSPVTAGWAADVFRRRDAARVAVWVQDPWPEVLTATGALRGGPVLRAAAAWSRRFYRFSDTIFVQSRAFVQPMLKHGVEPDRIAYLPNWAPEYYHPLSPSQCTAESEELPAGIRLVYGGNLGASQALETVLDAAASTRDLAKLRWVFVGDGRERQHLEAEVRRRGLCDRVTFLGQRPSEAMPCYFGAADALIVSLADRPAFDWTVPSKVQSYLACGRPILASLNGEGARLLEESGAAYVSRSEDAQALATNVRRFAATTLDQRRRLGQQARDYYVREFDAEKGIDTIEDSLKGRRVERSRACAA